MFVDDPFGVLRIIDYWVLRRLENRWLRCFACFFFFSSNEGGGRRVVGRARGITLCGAHHGLYPRWTCSVQAAVGFYKKCLLSFFCSALLCFGLVLMACFSFYFFFFTFVQYPAISPALRTQKKIKSYKTALLLDRLNLARLLRALQLHCLLPRVVYRWKSLKKSKSQKVASFPPSN